MAARGDVRRAKLYYLRERLGRGARVRGAAGPARASPWRGAMPADDAPRPGEEASPTRCLRTRPRPGAPAAEGAEAASHAEPGDVPSDEPSRRPRATRWTLTPRQRRTCRPQRTTPAMTRRRRPRTRPTDEVAGLREARGGSGHGGPQQSKHQSTRGSLIELVTIVAVALGLALGIQAFLVKPFRIPSESMVPTLEVGQRVLVDREHRFGDPDRGDIVVFKPPKGSSPTRAASSIRATRPARDRPRSFGHELPSSASWARR